MTTTGAATSKTLPSCWMECFELPQPKIKNLKFNSKKSPQFMADTNPAHLPLYNCEQNPLEFRLRQNKEAHYCRLNALKDERSKTSD
jgi:hypothetical protein